MNTKPYIDKILSQWRPGLPRQYVVWLTADGLDCTQTFQEAQMSHPPREVSRPITRHRDLYTVSSGYDANPKFNRYYRLIEFTPWRLHGVEHINGPQFLFAIYLEEQP